MANFISIFRIFVAFLAIYLLFWKTTLGYGLALLLTAIAFALDGLDGYIARKFNESSDLGSVLDIMGDRIVEASYWIVFAVLGWINILFPDSNTWGCQRRNLWNCCVLSAFSLRL